jgi:predicted nucleic acid-binding protein
LDTNAYAILLEKQEALYHRLWNEISKDGILSFFISEITSMEIHSVIGKKTRAQINKVDCKRNVTTQEGVNIYCNNYWFTNPKILKKREVNSIRKYLQAIESKQGTVQATIKSINNNCIAEGRNLLQMYSGRYSLRSLDSLIAGTALHYQKSEGLNFTIVTSDKALKNVLKMEGIPFFDPKDQGSVIV